MSAAAQSRRVVLRGMSSVSTRGVTLTIGGFHVDVRDTEYSNRRDRVIRCIEWHTDIATCHPCAKLSSVLICCVGRGAALALVAGSSLRFEGDFCYELTLLPFR